MIGDGSGMLEHEVNLNDDDDSRNNSARNLLESEGDVKSPQRASLEAAIEDDDESDKMRNAGVNGASRLVLSESRPVEASSTPAVELEPPLTGSLRISIRSFEKRGEGMNAYVVYLVVTEVSDVTSYTRTHYEVWRRFSDFLGLHEKLAEKLAGRGIVLPHPPEKSVAAAVSKKTGADAGTEKSIAELRKRLLERYMGRLATHGALRADCDVRDFLTMEVELPRATNTSTLSSAGMKRMFKSVGEAFSKMAVHMEEGDRWFETEQGHVDEQEEAIKRMQTVSESLVQTRRDLAALGETFSKSLSLLASCEESTALARCLSHLTEAEEAIGGVWERQAEADTRELAEAVGEYVSLFNSMKSAFAERHRVWQNWQTAQQNITKKREQKTRLELAGKTEKAAALRAETEEAVQKADQLEVQFDRISKEIKSEHAKFDATRKQETKTILIHFLQTLITSQEELLKAWQRFAPEAAVIPV